MGDAVINSAAPRLSAVRAFLGLIRPDYRRIAIEAEGNEIRLRVLLAEPQSAPLPDILSDISAAATEIVADFSDCTIRETPEVWIGPLPPVHAIENGVVYERWEPSR